MTDDLNRLVPDAKTFLTELAANNTRDWFSAQKPRYEAELKAPALAVLDIVAADLERLTGAATDTKLFRPNRDVRFSKDKTPYHTHLHMMWSGGGTSWFLGIAPDYVTAGAGVFAFDKGALIRWREAVAGPQGEAFQTLIDGLLAKGARLDEPALKRVPSPYGKDHPHGALLRRKGLAIWFDATETDIQKDGLTTWVRAVFSELLPVQTALRPLL